MITRPVVALAASAVVIASVFVSADSWPGSRPQVFTSARGTFAFKTRPPQLNTWSGKSQGTMVALAKTGGETATWTRELVNIPVTAFVADDGKHVVTFDTWARLGYEHALVIYGEDGAVIVDYDLNALVPAEEIRRSVIETVGGRRWLQDATIALDGGGDAVVITLRWGRVIRVALATGHIATAQ